MSNMISKEDISKLRSESIQLRGQQFSIVTLALASTGIVTWLIPNIYSSIEDKIGDFAVVTVSLVWLLLLGIFFLWSLSLKRLIDIISGYLKTVGESDWEKHFYQFHKESNIHVGQTRFSYWIFLVYGIIVMASGIAAAGTWEGRAGVALLGATYVIVCSWKYKTNSKDSEIEATWENVITELKKKNL